MNTAQLQAMREDAGDMYDLLATLVYKYDDGKLKDCVVKHNNESVWLIDELCRGLVEKHEAKHA